MTNADKILKDGVTIDDFEDIYHDWLIKDMVLEPEREIQLDKLDSVMRFLRTPCNPTLTEDERVILRNIDKKYHYIGRGVYGESNRPNLYISSLTEAQGWTNFYAYDYLFQFIKNGEEYEIKELLKDE